MASVQTGVATIFGFAGLVSGLSGAVTFFKESGDVSGDIHIAEVRDEDDELRGLIHSGESWDWDILFTPEGVAATGIAALGAAIVAPTKGAQITVTLCKVTALNTADWVYVGSWKLAFKKDGVLTYACKIKRSPVNNISTPVAA